MDINAFISALSLAPLDVATYAAVFALIVAIVIASNREMRKSREQERMLEETLVKERLGVDFDGIRQKKQEEMSRLAKAAEFGKLSEGLVHDLITPLTSIVLQNEKSDNPASLAASRRMASYIKDIRMTLSREEKERQCNAREELGAVLRLLAYKIRNDNIRIVTEESPVLWRGNPLKLQQIFLNLISNSIDSFEGLDRPDGKLVVISIREADSDNIIKIEDNGCGIKKENMDSIFSPFFTTKPADKGTGIGLSTVKSIVERDLGGSIAVASEEGRGSTFTITFPKA